MNSKLLILVILLVPALLSWSCTEKQSFEPEMTSDSDWAPWSAIAENDYGRIELTYSYPPRKELLRNIQSYWVQLREDTAASFRTIDTLYNHTPAYVNPQWQGHYSSDPILEPGSAYNARMVVNYHNGESRPGYSTSFVTPPERGRVLRRISLLTPDNDGHDGYTLYYYALASSNGKLYVLENEEWSDPQARLVQVDTATGLNTVLLSDFKPSTWGELFISMCANGDTLFTFYESEPSYPTANILTLVKLNVSSLQIDSSLKVPMGSRSIAGITHDGNHVRLFAVDSSGTEVLTMNQTTGSIIPPTITIPYYRWEIVSTYNQITWTGSGFWSISRNSFDNRIRRFDPATLFIQEDHHNPIFDTAGLAWDGASFWVVDGETNSVAKIELSGI